MLKKLLIIIILIISSSYSQSVTQKFAEAMEAYYQGMYASAYYMYENISDDYGIDDEIYASAKYYAADALLKLGEKESAAAEFEYIVNHIIWSNFREEALYHLGLIYFDMQKYATARARFNTMLKEFPEGKYSGSAMYWIGESFAEEGKLDDAVEFLQNAIKDKTTNDYRDYSIYALASVYERKGEYENAVKNYDELLSYYRTSPLLVSAQIRIGFCYFFLKDYQASILELNNPILDNLPDNLYSESLFLLANSHYRVKEYSDAEKVYSELIDKFPASEVSRDAKYGLAWTLFQQRKYDDAYILFENLSMGDDSIAIESFFWKAESKRYNGDREEAINIYRDLLSTYPNSFIVPRVEFELGLLYFNLNDLTLSKRYLLTAASSEENNVKARAFTLLGEIELSNKQYASAKNYFEPVPGYAEKGSEIELRSMLGLGSALYYLGDYDDAIQNLNLILASSPDFERDRVIYYLAENYFSKQNYSEALKRYKVIDTQDEEIKKMVLYGSAYCYFNLADYDNAAYRFSEFTKIYPGDERITDVKLRLADSYFGSKNYKAASEVYKQIFSSRNITLDDPYAYYQYAQALYKSGRTESAINEFSVLQRRYPDSKYGDVSLFTIGWIHFQQNDYGTAIIDYQNVMSVYNNTSLTPLIYYSIGDAFFNLGNYDSAIVNYQKVLSDYPSSSYVFDAVNGIQYSYVAKNQPEKAITLIDRFVAQNPSLSFSDQIYFKKAELYYSQRDYENAKESYKDFVVKFNKSSLVPEAYYWIGKCSDNLKQYEEAIFYFYQVFQKYPSDEIAGSAVLEMGAIHNSLGNYEAAINTYTEATSKIKGSSAIPEILYMKGVTYINADSLQKAYEVFTDVTYYYRESLFADKSKFEMGIIDLAAGRYENSDKYFLEISENRNDELGAKAQYYYGQSLFEQGNITEAISALVRVRTVFSNYDEWLTKSYILLGDCYVELKDNRKAEEMYRSVIAKHRNDIYGQEAREKIKALN